nr:uncharacterized protein LOC109423270 [Aedes albopictus]
MESTCVAVILTFLLMVGTKYSVLAAVNDHATALSTTEARAVVEPRGDWYNQIGFPQQFFGAQLAWFNVGFYFMLAFLKIFLLMGIWPVFNEKSEEVPPIYDGWSGYGQSPVYYSIPSWPTYG